MADRIEPFDVTFTAGSTPAAPDDIDTRFADGVVIGLEVDVPPGPSGFVGFKVLYSGVPVIPYRSGTYVVADDVNFRWPISNQGTSGRWSFRGYNSGVYDHTLRVRFLINELTSRTPEPITLVGIE